MKTLQFNRSHKNGWISYKIPGVPGAVFVDSRMLTDEAKTATPPATMDLDFPGFREPGADATEAQRLKAEKKAANDAKKAERAQAAATKATARLEKLQAAAAKAQAAVDAKAAQSASASA